MGYGMVQLETMVMVVWHNNRLDREGAQQKVSDTGNHAYWWTQHHDRGVKGEETQHRENRRIIQQNANED